MNIIIKNQNNRILDSLNTDVIKTLTGEFTREEAGEQLVNLQYNKAIVDITAIKNHYDANTVVAFLRALNLEKVVLLLNDSDVINSNSFLGLLVQNGVYSFTRNAAGISFLLANPNKLENVAQYASGDAAAVSLGLPSANQPTSYAEEHQPQMTAPSGAEPLSTVQNQKVIGVQNLSNHAGATTFAYLLIRKLKPNYKVKGIEMHKQDFMYFRDPDLSMCTGIDDFKMKLKEYAAAEVIIIDLNDFDASEFCTEMLYLVDPGILSLNKLMKKDSNVVNKVRDGKVILNRSSIKQSDIGDFEHETKFKVFFNMPNINDREEHNQMISALLSNLGFKN